jgi:hypothetical protein
MAILLWASSIVGQSTFGGIVGVVRDPGEGTIANAQITLTNLDDHAQRNASAESNGGFEFVNLKPGHYELVIHADGFSDYRISSLQPDARRNLRLDATLKLATSAQTVEVSSDRGSRNQHRKRNHWGHEGFSADHGAARELSGRDHQPSRHAEQRAGRSAGREWQRVGRRGTFVAGPIFSGRLFNRKHSAKRGAGQHESILGADQRI